LRIAAPIVVVVAVAAVAAGQDAREATTGTVPAAHRALYGQLEQVLEGWERFMDRRPGPPGSGPVWAGELLAANSNRGEQLLRKDTLPLVRLFLDRFRALGLRGVTLSVNYPLLAPDFPRAREYESFYREVASEARRRGLALEVESGVLFADTAFSSVSYDYRSLGWGRLVAGRRAHVEAILRATRPDHLDIGAEPDTEARLTNQPRLEKPGDRVAMIRTILTGLDRGSTRFSAGIGTWGDPAMVRAYIDETGLDEISLHVYPVGRRTLRTLYEVLEMARRADKPLLIDECWLYKAGPGEGQSIAANEKVFTRDLWSFWAPLDARFLGAVDRMARQEGVVWVSPFWTHQLFAYLEYDAALERRSYSESRARHRRVVLEAARDGSLSPTGRALEELLRRH